MRIRGHQRWYRNSMRGPSGDATSEMSSMHSLSARCFLESEHIAQSVWRFFLPGTQRRRGSIVDFLKALPCPLCGVVEIAQRRDQLLVPVARSAGAQHLHVTWQVRTVCAPSNAKEANQEAQLSGVASEQRYTVFSHFILKFGQVVHNERRRRVLEDVQACGKLLDVRQRLQISVCHGQGMSGEASTGYRVHMHRPWVERLHASRNGAASSPHVDAAERLVVLRDARWQHRRLALDRLRSGDEDDVLASSGAVVRIVEQQRRAAAAGVDSNSKVVWAASSPLLTYRSSNLGDQALLQPCLHAGSHAAAPVLRSRQQAVAQVCWEVW